jgi:ribonuclease BN (tRNA processing enzyme)
MATELVLLGTAGAPMPVAGRAGISSALIVDGRVFVIDCGRGSPSAFAGAGLDFSRLEAVFLTHLHADHTGDLAGPLPSQPRRLKRMNRRTIATNSEPMPRKRK